MSVFGGLHYGGILMLPLGLHSNLCWRKQFVFVRRSLCS